MRWMGWNGIGIMLYDVCEGYHTRRGDMCVFVCLRAIGRVQI